MPYLLNLLYLFLLLVASPWLAYKALRTGKYRQGFAQKFLGSVPIRSGDRHCLWFHAVSVGEVNLLASLFGQIARERPTWVCVLSTTTVTGFELARKKYPQLAVFYCPLDFSWAVRRAMRRIRPRVLVLAELELWPNLIRAAGEQGAKVAVVNGRLSPRSFRGYRRIRWALRSTLERLDVVAAQTEQYAQRFRDLGAIADRVHVTGSMKFDGAQTSRDNLATRRLARLADFEEGDVVFLAGSTQAPEEALAVAAFRELRVQHPQLRLVIVPRHRERFEEVARILAESSLPWQRRSRLEADGPDSRARILLVDAIGELAAWWGTATIAFVGGSLGRRGGQNMIEPAAYGAAVSFGPNTQNFRDIVALLLAGKAAVVVQNGRELTNFVRRCLEDPEYATELGGRAQSLVAGQIGATQRTLQLIKPLLAPSSPVPAAHYRGMTQLNQVHRPLMPAADPSQSQVP